MREGLLAARTDRQYYSLTLLFRLARRLTKRDAPFTGRISMREQICARIAVENTYTSAMPKARVKADTEPRYPYTTSPAALRRLLQQIPTRPRPGKLSLATLKTWKVASSNDATPLRVLRKLGMLGPAGEPLQGYTDYMQSSPTGPRALGARIKEAYKELFESSHEPHKNSGELQTFFRIHSGGGERTIEYQVQTFKALSEYADFSGATPSANGAPLDAGRLGESANTESQSNMPPVRIDLHIHLPENKTARDYEAIIQDIAKYIYGRTTSEGS